MNSYKLNISKQYETLLINSIRVLHRGDGRKKHSNKDRKEKHKENQIKEENRDGLLKIRYDLLNALQVSLEIFKQSKLQ